MSKDIAAIVDAPKLSLAENEKTGEALLNFYRSLGWNGVDNLDPCKVRTTKEVYNSLYDFIYDKCPDPVGVGMLMINSGPGTDAYIPKGKVYLYEGWTIPVKIQIGGRYS